MTSDKRIQRLLVANWSLMAIVVGLCVLLVVRSSLLSSPLGTAIGPTPTLTANAEPVDDNTNSATIGNQALTDRGAAAPVASELKELARLRREIAQEEVATTTLFRSSSPSVVHITTHSVKRDVFTLNLHKIPSGSGTGFVWDRKGHIVTNFHVIKDADVAYVAFGDQESFVAQLVGVAPEKDLAVLKIEADPSQLRPLPLGSSSDLEVGSKAFALGNPFGLDHTLTMGIISALGREIESTTGLPIKDVIQTDAAINPGNSGGPLLDSHGRLIGVNTAIYSPSGTYAGIGFAIPVDIVKWAVPELIKHGKIIRAGLAVGLASDRLMRQLRVSGVLILDVRSNTKASAAGLRPTRRTRYGEIVLGDIIVAINNQPVADNKELLLTLEKYKVGDSVQLTLLRDGSEVKVSVELELAD